MVIKADKSKNLEFGNWTGVVYNYIGFVSRQHNLLSLISYTNVKVTNGPWQDVDY